MIVHGNSVLGAGDIISFDLPMMRPLSQGANETKNPYISGRYLITSIKHMISTEMQKYQMSLKCSKDAVKEGYIPETYAYQDKKETPAVYDIYEEDKLIMSNLDINPVDYT